MIRNQATDESTFASNGSASIIYHTKRRITKDDSPTSDYGSSSTISENGASDGSYLYVSGVRATHLQFQATCQNDESGSDGYFEVYQVLKTGGLERDGYLTKVPQAGDKYLEKNEISFHFNKNGQLNDIHGYLTILDVRPKCSNKYQVPDPKKKIVTCIAKEEYKRLKQSHLMMIIGIAILTGLCLVAFCLFLLTWFEILNRKVCPVQQIPAVACLYPSKYNVTMGENVTIEHCFPSHSWISNIYVDLHRTRVRNQDERLFEVNSTYIPMTNNNGSKRVCAYLTRSDSFIHITITIQGTQCHDHGYIAINVSGVLIVYLDLEVMAPIKPCPRTGAFKWNATEFINCSVCTGNANGSVTWFHEENGSYVPVPKLNDSNVLNPSFSANGLDERIVSMVDFAFGIIVLKLVNRRVFCSDGGIYKVSLLPESIDQNIIVNITINGYLESCLPMWELKLIDSVRRNCSFCIGATTSTSNLTITQRGLESSKLELLSLTEGISIDMTYRDSLTIEANLISGLVNIQFKWSRVQCTDEGFYEILGFRSSGRIVKNISISIDELAFLKAPAIIQENGEYGGFAEGFNLSLTCNVANIGCKKREINITLPNRNATFECTYISLDTRNLNDSYTCSLTWTEFNISRDLNETTFYCEYTYVHNNGTMITFQSNLTIFVIPSDICKTVTTGCKMSHPLGGRYFIECDRHSPYRPWEILCLETLVFKAGTNCNGKCEYP